MSTGAILSDGLGTFGNVATILTDGLSTSPYLPQPPLAGTQYKDQTVIYAGTGLSLQQGASPAIAIGDVFITPTTVTPAGYNLQVNIDGTIVVFAGGDTSRQYFSYSRFALSTKSLDGPAICWIDETPPVWISGVIIPTSQNNKIYPNVPITPINLAVGYCASPWGDPLTFTLVSGSLPTGLSMSPSGIISGTPTQPGAFQFTVSASDLVPMSTISPPSTITISTLVLNTAPALVQWVNNSSQLVNWFSGSYLLYNGVAPGTYGKYVGLTITSTGAIYQLNALDMDYKLRARWS